MAAWRRRHARGTAKRRARGGRCAGGKGRAKGGQPLKISTGLHELVAACTTYDDKGDDEDGVARHWRGGPGESWGGGMWSGRSGRRPTTTTVLACAAEPSATTGCPTCPLLSNHHLDLQDTISDPHRSIPRSNRVSYRSQGRRRQLANPVLDLIAAAARPTRNDAHVAVHLANRPPVALRACWHVAPLARSAGASPSGVVVRFVDRLVGSPAVELQECADVRRTQARRRTCLGRGLSAAGLELAGRPVASAEADRLVPRHPLLPRRRRRDGLPWRQWRQERRQQAAERRLRGCARRRLRRRQRRFGRLGRP